MASLASTDVYNPTTLNPIGTIKGGKVTRIQRPEFAMFSWPLWVGKTWDTAHSTVNFERNGGGGWLTPHRKVAAYEDVTVPAGTFKAFRIEQTPGSGYSADSSTYWYAPAVKVIVKAEYSSPNYSLEGWTRRTYEFLTIPT
jgi:hypothetical protein